MRARFNRFWDSLRCTFGFHDWRCHYGALIVKCHRCGEEHNNRGSF